MRLTIFTFLLLILNQNVCAQEQFLKLDSIQIINNELNMISTGSNSFEGRDTLTVQAAPNQIIKVRFVGLTVVADPYFNLWFKNGSAVDPDHHIIDDLSILLGNFAILNGRDNFSNVYSGSSPQMGNDQGASNVRFVGVSPNLFMKRGEPIAINFAYSKYSNQYPSRIRHINYRIELVYYSYAP